MKHVSQGDAVHFCVLLRCCALPVRIFRQGQICRTVLCCASYCKHSNKYYSQCMQRLHITSCASILVDANVSSMPCTLQHMRSKSKCCRAKQQGATPRAGRPVLPCSPPESASARKPKLRPRLLMLLSRRKRTTPQRMTPLLALQLRWARECFFAHLHLANRIVSEGQRAALLM